MLYVYIVRVFVTQACVYINKCASELAETTRLLIYFFSTVSSVRKMCVDFMRRLFICDVRGVDGNVCLEGPKRKGKR